MTARIWNKLANVSLITAFAAITQQPAFGQSNQSGEYLAVITADKVNVRCGPADSYYPLGQLKSGDVIKVTGEKYNWARVAAVGPTFNDAFGFVKYSKDDAGRFRLADDGQTGVTLGRLDVVAPNHDADNDPTHSWKSLVRLDANATLSVLETLETDQQIVHKVVLPEHAAVWVSVAYVRAANESEIESFKAHLAETHTHTTPPARSSAVQPVKRSSEMAAANANESEAPAPDSVTAVEPGEPVINPPVPQPAPERKAPTLEDLEAAFASLQMEPIETAEVQPLRALYLEFAKNNSDSARIARYAKGRAEQLKVWEELQHKRLELDSVRNQLESSASEVEIISQKIEDGAEYAAIGKLTASTIYDGTKLPKLIRIQDPGTSRTLAYLEPNVEFGLVNLLGSIVGVKGEKTFDEILRLNIITPRRVDILTAKNETAPAATAEPSIPQPTPDYQK